MRRRVFLIAGEYSANHEVLTLERRSVDFLRRWHEYADKGDEFKKVFFRAPHRSDAVPGAKLPDLSSKKASAPPVLLKDLLASAAHRAICSLNDLLGHKTDGYELTRQRVTHLIAASMPGLDPSEQFNMGLIPQSLRGILRLSFRCQCHFQVGTSDSGAWAFAEAVRIARSAETPATVLITAGQIIPSGYEAQYHIRSVLGEHDQRAGLDMLAAGDLWMDIIRRSYGVSRQAIRTLLESVAARKLQAAHNYPAARFPETAYSRDAMSTPYFAKGDIASPCCGAAAAIVTSDEQLIEQIAHTPAARPPKPRYQSPPIVEVLGVGEGSSNPDLLGRQSPLVFAPAIRQAFAAAADDAMVPTSVFSASAFAVLHDAFPSIELSFLLSLGFDWDSATYRMQQYWPNPFGGLLTFGHALGASGLVQVVKALHTFSGDRRYVRTRLAEPGQGGEPPHGYPDDGSFAFTTSVGGPLSHIVVTLLRGGHAEPLRTAEHSSSTSHAASSEAEEWHARRQQLRRSMQAYLHRLRDELGRSPGGEAWLVEGVSRVNIRSCLLSLGDEDMEGLSLDLPEDLFKAGWHEKAKTDLLHAVDEVREAWREQFGIGGRMLSYDGQIEGVVMKWLQEEALQEDALRAKVKRGKSAQAPGHEELLKHVADLVKERLGMYFMVIAKATDESVLREVRFLPLAPSSGASGRGEAIGAAELEGVDIVLSHHEEQGPEVYSIFPIDESITRLPWWNGRAARLESAAHAPRQLRSAGELLQLLLGEGNGPSPWERPVDLDFLRTYFSPFVPRVATEIAMQAAGVQVTPLRAQSESVPVALYWNEIIAKSDELDWRTACELNGEAVNQARGWLGMYMINAVQSSGSVRLVSFDARLRHGVGARREAILSAARFARDVALWSLRHAIQLRAVVSIGVDGLRFNDVNHHATATSTAEARAQTLLQHVRATYEHRGAKDCSIPSRTVWICFDLTNVGVAEIRSTLAQHLPGWQLLCEDRLRIEGDLTTGSIEFTVWSYPNI